VFYWTLVAPHINSVTSPGNANATAKRANVTAAIMTNLPLVGPGSPGTRWEPVCRTAGSAYVMDITQDVDFAAGSTERTPWEATDAETNPAETT